ncbi:diguanylate cyclase [Moraxellaceae bacterium AER2_44_116]|nr:diguanylate cyclase [Moraxellaceae bacterium]TQC97798.1 diguanylate cyclase [Moraxellaceae bacterium AER2_44_116]
MEQLFALKRKLILALSITIGLGFFIALFVSYSVAKVSLHHSLVNQQLPLTSHSFFSDLTNDDLGLFITPRPTAYQNRYHEYVNYGINQEKINTLINLYKKEYNQNIYLVNLDGDIIISTRDDDFRIQANLHKIDSLSYIAESMIQQKKGSYQYQLNGHNYLLNVRYLPDFQWLLLVDTNENEAIANIRHSLYINIFIAIFCMLTIIWLINTLTISYQWQLKKIFNEIATSDKLTGLANRRTFDIMINHVLANSLRNQTPVTLIIMQIDTLKDVHYKYGILAVESIIQQIGDLIKSSIRASDVGCRWSDEQFLITLNQCQADKAHIIADALRMNIESAVITHNNQTLHMTISVGLSQYHVNDTVTSLIERTHSALTQAKAMGGNKVIALKPPYSIPASVARQSPPRFNTLPAQMPV